MKKWLQSSICLLLAIVMVVSNAAFVRADESMNPADSSWDIPLSALEVSCGDYETNGGANEGPANLAVDNNNATMWHTDWEGTSRDNHWFQFKLTEDYAVDGLRYLPRQTGNSNGTITRYDIQVSDDGTTFRSVATGTWENNTNWKIAQFDPETVQYVRLVSVDAITDNDWVFASAAEIRLTGQTPEISNADKTALDALIAVCEQIEKGNYTEKSWQAFRQALVSARSISDNDYATQARVDAARETLSQAQAGLKEKVEGEGIQKILHLDSGRKFFSKDWTIALINEMAAAGYTHLQLAFGNNGFRFLLDDMTIEANNTTYASDAIKAGVKIGNDNYGALTGYVTGDKHALTEAEMDEIIAHGKSVGVEIIPHLNMPGHMSALLDAMDHIGIENSHFTGSAASDSSVNLNNEEALEFMKALVDKYAEYFAAKGCKYFHIGADEYANDAYNGSMGFPSMGAALYEKFAEFVNENAAIVKSHGMTPRAWNDGVYYGGYTSEFDSDIEINYWSSGWSGYTLARAAVLDQKGHGLINTNGDYYYILGKDDKFTPGTGSQHDPNMYTVCEGYDLTHFMDGSTIEEPVGGMFCIWADFPGRETEQQVGANIRLLLRAMALRMEDLSLDGMDTSVVPGGFNEDGTIAAPAPDPEVTAFTADKTELPAAGGEITVTVTGTNLKNGIDIKAGELTAKTSGTATEQTATLTIPANETEEDVTYTIQYSLDGEDYTGEIKVTVAAAEAENPAPSDPDDNDPKPSEPDDNDPKPSEPEDNDPKPSEPEEDEPKYELPECGMDDDCVLSQFSDVKTDDWYHDGVHFCVDHGIVNGMGNGTFAPNDPTTRAQLVTMLYRLEGEPSIEGLTEPFTDVSENDWFYAPIVWAYNNKVVNGMTETTFAPDAKITREQVATILHRYLGTPAGSGDLSGYPDADKVQDYAKDALTWAVGEGLINGVAQTDGTSLLAPDGNATRAQIATILMRYLTA